MIPGNQTRGPVNFVRTFDRGKVGVRRVLVGEGLRAKAMRGGMWLGGGSAAEQVCRFVRNMVLARLLAPADFGTMAIVMSSSSAVGALIDVGARAAVIQRPRGGEDGYLNAAWWLGMARAVLFYVTVFAMAPWVSRFYGQSDLSALLRVALVGALLDGAISPRSALPQKQLNFSRWALINNGGAICGVIFTVVLSVFLRDVWALSIGFCSESAFRCLLSYILCPGLPSLKLDQHAARDLLKFSRGLFGLSLLNLIFARADIFVLGKLVSPAVLGLYAMSVSLVQTPIAFLIKLLADTLMPTLSHVQEDMVRMNRILVEVSSWVILLGLPAVIALWHSGPSLLTVIYGTRYASIGGILAVAAGVMFLNTLNSLITNAFYAWGRPGLHRRAVAASAVTMLIAIYPACRWLGVMGGQVAALLAIVVSYVLQVSRMHKLTGLNVLRYADALVPAALFSVGVLGVGVFARFLGLAQASPINIALSAGACVVAYALSTSILLRPKENP
jgi:O-antigen/teichoic acid export membrane protein